MKKILSFVFFALTLGAHAQVLPQNQCRTPNVLISRDFIGLSSETVGQNFDRAGSAEIPTTASMSGVIKARIFRDFEEVYCVARVHSYQERVCQDVDPDLAVGRGNKDYDSLFDLTLPLAKRADHFARIVSYGLQASEAARQGKPGAAPLLPLGQP